VTYASGPLPRGAAPQREIPAEQLSRRGYRAATGIRFAAGIPESWNVPTYRRGAGTPLCGGGNHRL